MDCKIIHEYSYFCKFYLQVHAFRLYYEFSQVVLFVCFLYYYFCSLKKNINNNKAFIIGTY